jgi:hypothetical protein
MLAASVVDRALSSTLFWSGLGLGFVAGSAFAVMRRAWSDHSKVKASVPGLRKAAWGAVGGFVRLALIVGVLVIVSIAWLAGYRTNVTTPASVPTAPATSTPAR